MQPTIAKIKTAVCDHYGLPIDAMSADKRCREYAWPRQVSMCLSYRLTEHSQGRIGHFHGGRHHSTVISSLRAVSRRTADSKVVRDITLSLIRPSGLLV